MNGGHIRHGALIRSDNLDRLTPAGIDAVRAAGISRIVDLRSTRECEWFPSPVRNDPSWRNIPLLDPADPDESHLSLAIQFVRSLDRNPHLIASAIAAIADAPDGCVLVHCHAGKDRTGVVVGLALSLASVAPEVIAADYAQCDDPEFADATAALPELEAPRLETMREILAHLENSYGSIHEYLAHAGLTTRQADAVSARLTRQTAH